MLLFALLFLAFDQAEAIPPQRLSGSNSSAANSTLQGTSKSTIAKSAWVSGPSTRGTFGLVFSCVITLFLCVWTTVHVNIDPPANGKSWIPKRAIKKFGWACATLIFPEGAMAIAHYERMTAWRLLKEMKKLYDNNQKFSFCDKIGISRGEEKITNSTWNISLAYYVVMGGFVVDRCDPSVMSDNAEKMGSDEITSISDDNVISKEAEKNNKSKKPTENGGSERARYTLTPLGVLELARRDLETNKGEHWRRPPITPREVEDKSNTNTLAKVLVVWQALWMIVQVIGRHAGGLSVSLLELHTCLHTFCAVVMFFTWWGKPTDIEVPTVVSVSGPLIKKLEDSTSEGNSTSPFEPDPDKSKQSKPDKPDKSNKVNKVNKHQYFTCSAELGRLVYNDLCDDKHVWKPSEYFEALSNAYGRLFHAKMKLEGLIIALVGLIYGGAHLAAWNYSFPSDVEAVLWKVAAIVTAIAWSAFVAQVVLGNLLQRYILGGHQDKTFSRVCGILFGVGIVPCLLVRLYLLVESFASIRQLPSDSYKLPLWSNVWPHAG
ncbi:hypothetical protein EG329_007924 [Mollisiaceae sp. DMI_Dod_QoI]|nr:hypothetical protein EG329_007924 [Helotiales sp. DMI_Dod_QoI]